MPHDFSSVTIAESVAILSLRPPTEIASIEHDPSDCLAKLDRGNAEHVRRVVAWLTTVAKTA